MAFQQAQRILSWQENLTEEETPPEWMWHLDHELEEWFIEVKRARDERYGGGGGDEHEVVPLTQNELTKGMRD